MKDNFIEPKTTSHMWVHLTKVCTWFDEIAYARVQAQVMNTPPLSEMS
jgi:hypothetical protein